jgi:hypothetical protein
MYADENRRQVVAKLDVVFITRASSDLSACRKSGERTTTKHFIAIADAMMLVQHASSLLLMH